MNKSFKDLEHHAYLISDELEDLKHLFDIESIIRIIVDINGNTSHKKIVSKDTINGITILNHIYVKVEIEDVIFESKEEIEDMIKIYYSKGAKNLYITKLTVEFSTGLMHVWSGRKIVAGIERNRTSKSNRSNTLVIPHPTFEGILKLQENYGKDIVKGTTCPIFEVITKKERVCQGSIPGL